MPLFAAIDPETLRWTPGIGDPTFGGWLAVFAYLAAVVVCGLNVRLSASRGDRLLGVRGFWAGLCCLLLLLAVNKQLDVQTLFTQVGRDIALSGGWYERRRSVQGAFIVLLGTFAVTGSVLLWRQLSGSWRSLRITCAGVVLLLGYIVIRAATFHHIDLLLGKSLAGVRLSSGLELLAIAAIVAGAWRWRGETRSGEAAEVSYGG